MSLRFLKRSEIDSRRWDDHIMKSPYGQVFFMSWYLDACCPGWTALVKGDYHSVFPLAGKKKLGIHYLYQPFFTRHFGMIGVEEFNREEGQEFLDAIPDEFKFIDFCLHKEHTEAGGFRTYPKTYQTLDLTSEDIARGYSENLKRMLRKAAQEGLRITSGVSAEHIVDSFRLHQPRVSDQFSSDDFTRLKCLMHAAERHNLVQCVGVQDPSGNQLSGAFFIGFKDTLLYLKGYSTEAGRKTGAMHFLFDRFIHANCSRFSTLDFGGSSVPGVARFYRHFGASDSLYLRIRSNRLPKVLRWIKK